MAKGQRVLPGTWVRGSVLVWRQSERCPTTNQKGKTLSRFKRLSHPIRQHEYHIGYVSKHRYPVLSGKAKEAAELCEREQSWQLNFEVQEMNV